MHIYCGKSVHIRSFSGPYFPTFGLNTERYSVRTRENTDQKIFEYRHFSCSDYHRYDIYTSKSVFNFWQRANINKPKFYDNDIKHGTVHFILLGWSRELQKVYTAPVFVYFKYPYFWWLEVYFTQDKRKLNKCNDDVNTIV